MADKEKDETRTKFLENQGFQVIRFWDNEVLSNVEGVLEKIHQQIRTAPSPYPSPLEGEGVK